MAGKQIRLKRKDGSVTWYKNSWFIPAFYFLPQSILEQVGSLTSKISRYPYNLFHDWQQIELIESDPFAELIIDAYHYMVWPYMNLKAGREIYSGFYPGWIFSHTAPYWIDALEKEGVIPSAGDLYRSCTPEDKFDYMDEAFVDRVLKELVPKVMEEEGMNQIIEAANEYQCFRDFDERKSRQKAAFTRQWYHWRTKHPEISLEEYLGKYDEETNEYQRDIEDRSILPEDQVVSEIQTENFVKSLSDKDRKILELRMDNYTYEKIAAELGFKTHSAVVKRIKRIGEAYQKYAKTDLGFD